MLRSTGIVMGGMTCYWAAQIMSHPLAVVKMIGVLVLIVGVGLCVIGLRQPDTPRVEGEEGQPKNHVGGVVGAIAAETVAIFVLIHALAGHPEFFVPVVAFVVALHFALFYVIFRQRIHLWTCLFGAVGTVGVMVAMATGHLYADSARALTGLCMSTITSYYGWWFLHRQAKRSSP